MRKNVILGLGAVCFVVVFALMIFGVVAYQQISSGDIKEDNTPEIVKPIEPPKELDIIPEVAPAKVFPVKQGCLGDARCISGYVTRIVDGDTIEVDGQSIRFALVDTPEYGEYDYTQARNYIENICPIGSPVLVDEDDLQTEGSYGRIIGVIYCKELNLNESILEVGHAEILVTFCSKSEFAGESWAIKYGCTSDYKPKISTPPTEIKEDCNPSYPDVCIPSPPPDLDCGEISHRNFTVLQPDPHRFDGDKDGLGCES